MLDRAFCFSVFAIIERLLKSEITNTSRQLIVNYIEEADGDTYSEKARAAIFRYSNEKIPSLEEIRNKANAQSKDSLSILEHLVLKMEYEASRI
ncbi:MAG: hypothetical protein EHM28_06175 [Spirochaetaceae bacterium]|nr:MAG: hypothetical protein EHM28_06175 [Spirochaetaceae bacterium]